MCGKPFAFGCITRADLGLRLWEALNRAGLQLLCKHPGAVTSRQPQTASAWALSTSALAGALPELDGRIIHAVGAFKRAAARTIGADPGAYGYRPDPRRSDCDRPGCLAPRPSAAWSCARAHGRRTRVAWYSQLTPTDNQSGWTNWGGVDTRRRHGLDAELAFRRRPQTSEQAPLPRAAECPMIQLLLTARSNESGKQATDPALAICPKDTNLPRLYPPYHAAARPPVLQRPAG